jgi:hypothetical protein
MFYTSSTPDLDAQAASASSTYNGIPYSTTPAAQSSQASYPSHESKPSFCAVVLQRVYPYILLRIILLQNYAKDFEYPKESSYLSDKKDAHSAPLSQISMPVATNEGRKQPNICIHPQIAVSLHQF